MQCVEELSPEALFDLDEIEAPVCVRTRTGRLPAFDAPDFMPDVPAIAFAFTFTEAVTSSATSCMYSVTVANENPYDGVWCYAQSPLGLAWVTVNVNDRTSGSGSSGSAGSNTGHGWTTITYDNGTSVTIGNYPGGPRNDAARQPTASQAFYVTDAQAAVAQTAVSQPGYNFFTDNCVDRVEDALNAAGIQHPNFNTLGVSDPAHLMDWLQPQTPTVPVPQPATQSQGSKWKKSTECK